MLIILFNRFCYVGTVSQTVRSGKVPDIKNIEIFCPSNELTEIPELIVPIVLMGAKLFED
jgi:hypothetical protein